MTFTQKVLARASFDAPSDISCKDLRELYYKFGREHENKLLLPIIQELLALNEKMATELTGVHDELLDWLRGGTGCPHCAVAMVKIGKTAAEHSRVMKQLAGDE